MNRWNDFLRKLTMEAPTEGTPTLLTPTTPPSPAATTDPAPAGNLLGDGTAPADSEGKGGDGVTPPEPVVPLALTDIKLPEGFQDLILTPSTGEGVADVTLLSSALEVMNDAALSPGERLQKLVDLQTQAGAMSATAQEAAWTDLQTQWRKEAEALPEIGGAKLPETLAQIKKGLDSIGVTKDFYDAMTLTGAGNNPHVLSALAKLTRGLVEGKPVLGEPPKGKLSLAEKLYPTMHRTE